MIESMRGALDAATAERFAAIALANVATDYPHKLDQVLTSEADVQVPRSTDAGPDDFSRWSHALQPLADAFAARFIEFLPRTRHPVRHGVHSNSAFALAFALDYARTVRDEALAATACAKAQEWFANDRDMPAAWEPSGADFLSPALVEAELMRRVLPSNAFGSWLAGFLPDFARGVPAALFAPVEVTDRSDPQLVHLDGLNLSRAWCLRGIAAALSPDDVRCGVARAAADAHFTAGSSGLASGDFAGAHWLASFALLALDA